MLFRDKEETIEFLIENRAYPVWRKGRIFFKKKLPEEIKGEIIERLVLKDEADCRSIREKIKEEWLKRKGRKAIREWVREERPREMLLEEGPENMPLAKLLAIILRTGSEGKSAEDLGRELLDRFRSLRGIDNAQASELRKVPGIGMAKAAQIKAAFELGKRLFREDAAMGEKIRDAAGAVRYVRNYFGPYLRDKKKEFFYVVFLDTRNKSLGSIEVSRGSLDASVVDRAEIVKEATSRSASAVILVHNHPSGEAEPSKEDIAITNEVASALNLVGIRVLDHIIIGRNEGDYFSFLNKGLLLRPQSRSPKS